MSDDSSTNIWRGKKGDDDEFGPPLFGLTHHGHHLEDRFLVEDAGRDDHPLVVDRP